MKIIPYKMGSASAKALANSLGILQIRQEGKPLRKLDTLINWGCSKIERDVGNAVIINNPASVKKASNKLDTLFLLNADGVVVPDWTDDRKEALKWLIEGFNVVVRHKLNGHSGEGIEIVLGENDNPNFNHQLPIAPLYVKYIPKKEEYRVHAFQGGIISIQRKSRKLDVPDEKVNWKVRNLNGGFIYATDGVDVPDDCKQLAINAIDALGLDFGAVDIIYNQ